MDGGLPLVTKIFAGGIFCLGLLCHFNFSALSLFSLSPGNVIWLHQYWSIFTVSFVETDLLSLILGPLGILVIGKHVEKSWGSREFIKYVVLMGCLIGVSLFFGVIISYNFFTRNENDLSHQFTAFTGLFGALLVPLKQILGDHDVNIVPSPGGVVKARFVPSFYLLFGLCFWVFSLWSTANLLLAFLGVFAGWSYLRFFQRKEGGVVGDRSDGFSFASFFPDPLQPVAKILANITYAFASRICVCCALPPAESFHAGASRSSGASMSGPAGTSTHSHAAPAPGPHTALPGSDPSDAERRRQLALRMLDQRLAKPKGAAKTATPANANSTPSPVNNAPNTAENNV